MSTPRRDRTSSSAPPAGVTTTPQRGNTPGSTTPEARPSGVPPPTKPLGIYPSQVTCPHCKTRVLTYISVYPGLVTWLTCVLLCLIPCCCCGCCLLPFCFSALQDVEHICPNCGYRIGINR